MNAVHPMSYHVVKAEEAHRLARLERRALATSSTTERPRPTQVRPQPVRDRRFSLPRAAGVGLATVALLLSMVATAAVANESSGGGGGGGANRVSAQ